MACKGMVHLTHEDRIKIEALYMTGASVEAIAAYVGRSTRTIGRELERGAYNRQKSDLTFIRAYSADIAQKDYDYKATAKGRGLKLGKDFSFADYVENMIRNEKFSPAALIREIPRRGLSFSTSVCTATLYNYIERGYFLGISNKDLLRKRDVPKHQYHYVTRVRNALCLGIESRPESINSREDIGHWEMDTVVGPAKGGGPVLLVLTERKSRKELIIKIGAKTTAEVVKALDRLEHKHGKAFYTVFKTITVDNGSEFMDTAGMSCSVLSKRQDRTTIYYCHPYSSWERGSNENANQIIRRFIPKGSDISKYTKKQIAYIERWINNYPRKLLGWKSAAEVYAIG